MRAVTCQMCGASSFTCKNGLYICGVALICLLIIERKIAKRLISSFIVIAAVYLLYAGPFSKALIVKQASSAELEQTAFQQN